MHAEEERIRADSPEGLQEGRKARCTDCIYLVQTRHHLSQQIIGYHCFSIGRQQEHPDHYDFTATEVEKEHDCEWFTSYDDFVSEHAEDADYAPKIQRYVTIRVRWGYDWRKAEDPEPEGKKTAQNDHGRADSKD